MFMNKKEARILVMDDDKSLADDLVDYLTKSGYRASAAYGGHEGLSMFEQGAFQLVITEFKMPDIDGMDLLKAVKAMDGRVIVMFITGHGTIESAVPAMKKGAYDYIPKPFKMEELEVIVNRALERHTFFSRLGVLRGLTLALIISVPFWLILAIILALVWK